MDIQLAELIEAGGTVIGPIHADTFTDWSYDSRLTVAGECFIALRTTRADGHDYIPAALAAGARGILCTRPPHDAGTATVVVCPDPQALLLRWASNRLQRLQPTVIAVTGGIGKTLARRAIAAVLATHAPTFQSRRNFNSLLGLPIALARLERDHQYAVLEFAGEHLPPLAAAFPPRLAVVTAGTDDATARFLARQGVTVIAAEGVSSAHLTFGTGSGCAIRATAISYRRDGVDCVVIGQGLELPITIPLPGPPGVAAALAAVAVGLHYGVRPAAIRQALAGLDAPAGRLRPLPGANGELILDDSFNATPEAMRAALQTLAAIPTGRRIAVLGTPTELPAVDATPLLTELGMQAARSAEYLVLKGMGAATMAQAARLANPTVTIHVVDTNEAIRAALPPSRNDQDVVLVSGGAGERLEQVVAPLLAPGWPPEQYLVRQEPAWRSVRIGDPGRPTWVHLDLTAIADNVRALRNHAGVPLMVVLKGDGYGHGAARVARAALQAGAEMLAVATLGEGRALRAQGIAAPILVLGYTPPWQAAEAIRLDLMLTLFDDDTAQALHAAALECGRPARVHVKVDTGMARLGLSPAEVAPFLSRLRELPGIEPVALYTHFARADEADPTPTEQQLARFQAVLADLTAAGLRPPCVHAANSAATLRFPATHFDMVRPGLACYGLAPGAAAPLLPGMRPALSFYTEVAQVKDHPAGTPISYGGTFVTARPSRIATIPVGYADGLRRSPPWREVLIRGQRAPIVGRICMDYAMVDVTDIPGVRRGDAVTIIGRQGDAVIGVDEIAGWLGTISYEVLTGILPRVPREIGP
ncbi:MAG TPA: alanine racemase [Chloroflexus aurantiacus]|uniref:Alanine racemase n=1 Tax=Chloroflexus aurantiacus (strain ATCC 29366 / DSM 635 / J-10-fl) TaxID=324602 RepID=A9WD45_CHLAA|nr:MULTISPECIES: alanine racemase [Chloroflexus]RMG47571.1 MAG: alanine racemase [Chloroflexota bacterium]ABY35012.1 alanine racemase [Chloroflexus aurantiacus J-10-fl]GIV92602.1 MAG: alanine racemase [Chloroflexus sp.]GIV95169.1 MAG: alanine racemase [Chloroflexus sp.]HBW68775.1 alanine racemase [Chloroflexus aurantiacus]